VSKEYLLGDKVVLTDIHGVSIVYLNNFGDIIIMLLDRIPRMP
jgi:hypothetical protein